MIPAKSPDVKLSSHILLTSGFIRSNLILSATKSKTWFSNAFMSWWICGPILRIADHDGDRLLQLVLLRANGALVLRKQLLQLIQFQQGPQLFAGGLFFRIDGCSRPCRGTQSAEDNGQGGGPTHAVRISALRKAWQRGGPPQERRRLTRPDQDFLLVP